MSTRSSKPARLSFKLEVEDEDKLEMGVEKGVREMKRCWVISFGAKAARVSPDVLCRHFRLSMLPHCYEPRYKIPRSGIVQTCNEDSKTTIEATPTPA